MEQTSYKQKLEMTSRESKTSLVERRNDVWVMNLPRTIDTQPLLAALFDVEKVTSSMLYYSKGYGNVHFKTAEDAQRAVDMFDGKTAQRAGMDNSNSEKRMICAHGALFAERISRIMDIDMDMDKDKGAPPSPALLAKLDKAIETVVSEHCSRALVLEEGEEKEKEEEEEDEDEGALVSFKRVSDLGTIGLMHLKSVKLPPWLSTLVQSALIALGMVWLGTLGAISCIVLGAVWFGALPMIPFTTLLWGFGALGSFKLVSGLITVGLMHFIHHSSSSSSVNKEEPSEKFRRGVIASYCKKKKYGKIQIEDLDQGLYGFVLTSCVDFDPVPGMTVEVIIGFKDPKGDCDNMICKTVRFVAAAPPAMDGTITTVQTDGKFGYVNCGTKGENYSFSFYALKNYGTRDPAVGDKVSVVLRMNYKNQRIVCTEVTKA